MATFSGVKSESLEKEKENFCVVLAYFVKRCVKLGSFKSQSCNDGEDITKKRDAHAQLLFC